jgi:hypothetical protein
MPKRYEVVLSEQEKQKLEGWVKNPPSPYLRERARAIKCLKVRQSKPQQRSYEFEFTAMRCRNGSSDFCQTGWKA